MDRLKDFEAAEGHTLRIYISKITLADIAIDYREKGQKGSKQPLRWLLAMARNNSWWPHPVDNAAERTG